MNKLKPLVIMVALTLVFALSARLGLALPGNPARPGESSYSQPTTAFSYQGYLEKENVPYTGRCDFKIALWDSAEDGQQIGSSLLLADQPVHEGYFSLQLDFGDDAFTGTNRWLAVEVSCPAGSGDFTLMGERSAVLPAPYALSAQHAPWGGLRNMPTGFADDVDDDTTYDAGPGLRLDTTTFAVDENWLDERFLRSIDHVVVVAKQGGDFDKIQAAIDSIADAAPKMPYLVYVAPGWYDEMVVMKPHITLQGAGERSTFITSAVGNETLNPASATLRLAAHSSVRDLTVLNSGQGKYSVALLANPSLEDVVIRNVTVSATGMGERNYGIFLVGGTDIRLEDVNASAAYASESNYGMQNAAAVIIRDGSFYGQGGRDAYGIANFGDLIATNTYAEGRGGSSLNVGFYFSNGGVASLDGGSFVGSGGNTASGIRLQDNGVDFTARNVLAQGEGAFQGRNIGLDCSNQASAVLNGGSFVGLRGENAVGIQMTECVVEATDFEATGDGGWVNSYGLKNDSGMARLFGGTVSGRAGIVQSCGDVAHAAGPGPGSSATGLYNLSESQVAVIEANGVVVVSEQSDMNVGLKNDGGSIQFTQGTITGTDATVFGSGGQTTLAHTRLQGGEVVSINGAGVHCILVSRGSAVSVDGNLCP